MANKQEISSTKSAQPGAKTFFLYKFDVAISSEKDYNKSGSVSA